MTPHSLSGSCTGFIHSWHGVQGFFNSGMPSKAEVSLKGDSLTFLLLLFFHKQELRLLLTIF